MHLNHYAAAAMLAVISASAAHAFDVTEFDDKAQWEDTVGHFTTLDFTGFEHAEPIVDQYADLGAVFNPVVFAWGPFDIAFPNDGWGFRSQIPFLVEFDSLQNWVAVDHPGTIAMDLMLDGEVIYESSTMGGGGLGFFSGIVSELEFDAVRLYRPSGNPVFGDDIHFGAIPAPGALLVFGMAGLIGRRRRG